MRVQTGQRRLWLDNSIIHQQVEGGRNVPIDTEESTKVQVFTQLRIFTLGISLQYRDGPHLFRRHCSSMRICGRYYPYLRESKA